MVELDREVKICLYKVHEIRDSCNVFRGHWEICTQPEMIKQMSINNIIYYHHGCLSTITKNFLIYQY